MFGAVDEVVEEVVEEADDEEWEDVDDDQEGVEVQQQEGGDGPGQRPAGAQANQGTRLATLWANYGRSSHSAKFFVV